MVEIKAQETIIVEDSDWKCMGCGCDLYSLEPKQVRKIKDNDDSKCCCVDCFNADNFRRWKSQGRI